MRVLVVDDSKVVWVIAKQILEKNLHQAVWAQNGAEALKIIQTGELFDVILLDWNMPVMMGPEFLQAYMSVAEPKAPVCMMTTENSPKHIMEALGKGATEYMMKPFTEDILIEKINRILEMRKAV